MISRRSFLAGTLAVGLAQRGRALAAPLVAKVSSRGSTVAVVRPSAFAGLGEALDAALVMAGGLGFIRPGQRVLLKPALNSENRYPATTDPYLVYLLGRRVVEAGGVARVGDRTMFLRSTERVLRKTGVRDAAGDAGIACHPFDDEAVVAVRHGLAGYWPDSTLHIYRPVVEAEHVINLCTPRTHRLGDFTMALKNLVGVVEGSRRVGMHRGEALRQRVAEISLAVQPSLIVLDGRAAFTDGGPDSGSLAHTDFLAVGVDPVAIDAVGLAFLRMAGTTPRIAGGSIWQLPLLAHAAEIGAGVSSASQIRILGATAALNAALRREMT